MSSKLDSCLSEIVAARAARKSWREIVTVLAERGVKTNVSGVYQYFQRARKKQVALERELRPFGQHAAPRTSTPVNAQAIEPSNAPAAAPKRRVIPAFKTKEKTPEEIENEKAWAEIDTSKMPG